MADRIDLVNLLADTMLQQAKAEGVRVRPSFVTNGRRVAVALADALIADPDLVLSVLQGSRDDSVSAVPTTDEHVVRGPYREPRWPRQWLATCSCGCSIRCNSEADAKDFLRSKGCLGEEHR